MAVSGNKKSRFVKNQKRRLGISTLRKITLIGNVLF